MAAGDDFLRQLGTPGQAILAPMSGVTDAGMRRVAHRFGASLVVSEMVAGDQLALGEAEARLRAEGDGLPVHVVQIAGCEAHWMAAGARAAEAAGATIIDINMGCPAKRVTNGWSGSALMRDLDQAERLIRATVEAVDTPVTLKMRLGWDDQSRNAPQIAAMAEGLGVKAITVHGRTRQQFYRGQADWRAVADVKKATRLPVIVNGDIIDAASARAALAQSGADAVMIGRGAYGRPWVAAALDRALGHGGEMSEPDAASRLGIALEHFTDTLRFYGDALGLKVFRKHLGWYVEQAAMPSDPCVRRAHKARLCQIDSPRDVESALTALWTPLLPPSPLPFFAFAHI